MSCTTELRVPLTRHSKLLFPFSRHLLPPDGTGGRHLVARDRPPPGPAGIFLRKTGHPHGLQLPSRRDPETGVRSVHLELGHVRLQGAAHLQRVQGTQRPAAASHRPADCGGGQPGCLPGTTWSCSFGGCGGLRPGRMHNIQVIEFLNGLSYSSKRVILQVA